MTVFRYEWKRSRKYILIWAAVLAICVFGMTPVYYGMIGTTDSLPENFTQGGFFEALGISLTLLRDHIGMYAFLNSFFMLAGGVFGMHFGLSMYAKECTENTAEYLFTKPCGRGAIFRGKTLCVLCGVCVVSAAYLAGSFLTLSLFKPGFPPGEFFLYAGSFFLTVLFLGALGLLWGSIGPHNRSPLLTAGLVIFLEYCVTSFANTIGNRILPFLSPFSFFKPAEIHELGFYRMDYLLWYLLLTAIFFTLSYRMLLKRDIKFVA